MFIKYPQIILCRTKNDLLRYMAPFAYHPGKSSVFSMSRVYCTCPQCGRKGMSSRVSCDLDKVWICANCNNTINTESNEQFLFVPFNSIVVSITPTETRLLGNN